MIIEENENNLNIIKSKVKFKEDPFTLVEKDLQQTKEFAINNIVIKHFKLIR